MHALQSDTLIHSFIRSFIHSFVHSFIHSFVHSFIHSFIHSLIHIIIHHSLLKNRPTFNSRIKIRIGVCEVFLFICADVSERTHVPKWTHTPEGTDDRLHHRAPSVRLGGLRKDSRPVGGGGPGTGRIECAAFVKFVDWTRCSGKPAVRE